MVVRRVVKRHDRPGLTERVGSTEQRLGLAPDRFREVLGLELVRVGVLDLDPLSHERLDKDQTTSWEDAGGRFTVGAALEIEGLIEAGIEQTDVFLAATRGDNTNLVIAQIAQRRFKVAKVVARVADPGRAAWWTPAEGVVAAIPRRLRLRTDGYQPSVPGAPLNGPTRSLVIQPP